MAALKCKVVTPDKTYFEGDAKKIVVPAWDGELGVLPGHAPLIARLGHGPLRVAPAEGAAVTLAVFGGFLKVQDDDVIVLAGGVAEPKDVEPATARKALEAAEQKLEATRPPKATQGVHDEALEAYRRARACVAAGARGTV